MWVQNSIPLVQSEVVKTLDDGQEWRDAHRRLSSLNEKLSQLMARTDLSEGARQQEIDQLLRDYANSELP